MARKSQEGGMIKELLFGFLAALVILAVVSLLIWAAKSALENNLSSLSEPGKIFIPF